MRKPQVRLSLSLVIVAASLLSYPSMVRASGPVSVGQPGNDTALTELTPQQQAHQAAKLARAAQVQLATGMGLAAQSCPEPEFAGLSGEPAAASPCTPATFTLQTRARQQATYYYCGPASGQVVSNLSWGIINSSTGGTTTTNNKYTQATIAGWMNTTTAGTSGANLASGLNTAAKRPSGFSYSYTAAGTGAQLHSKVVVNTWDWKMPLVLPVKPHDPGALYRLTSWPNAIEAWHWITIRGYSGFWDGTRNPRLYYNDSSAGYQGSTGAFVDPSFDIDYVNNRNTGNVVW